MLHQLYVLRPPDEPPSVPTHWSWSSLSEWRACPRRWWLLHAKYSFASNGRYPTRISADSLRGQIVHEALETYRTAKPPFDAYRHMRRRLAEKLREIDESNPRVHSGKLAASISLDRCCADFYDQVQALPGPHDNTTGEVRRETPRSPMTAPREAQELTIQVTDPPLLGRIDLVLNSGIIDYKTGSPTQGHIDQLRFYALLWWLRYGDLPAGLELRYGSETVTVPLPNQQELAESERTVRSELIEITRDLANGRVSPAARASVSTCQYCPVRQMCDEYWNSSQTLSLRQIPGNVVEGKPVFIDVELAGLPITWLGGRGLVGEVTAQSLGRVKVSIPATLCPSVGPAPVRARLLGATVKRNGVEVTVATNSASEVFWATA